MLPKTVELDKPRRLRFDVNALADCEGQLGMGLGKLLQQEATFSIVRVLLWAGLKWEDRGLTLKRAGDILQQAITNGNTTVDDISLVLLRAVFLDSGLFRHIPKEELKELEDPNAMAEAVKESRP